VTVSTPLSNSNRKQPITIYTVMLILTVVFLLMAIILLALEITKYKGGSTPWDTSNARPAVPAAGWIVLTPPIIG
jgi:hypothetical protein